MADACSAILRSKVLVWRGNYPSRQAVDTFDPVTKTWDAFPSAHEYRLAAASAVINGRLYVCGGHSNDRGGPSTSLDYFDPHRGIWQTLPPMSQGRSFHAAAVVDARLYVCGGNTCGRALGARLHVCGGACGRRAPIRRMLRHVNKCVAFPSSHVSSAILCRSGGDQESRVHRRWQGGSALLRPPSVRSVSACRVCFQIRPVSVEVLMRGHSAEHPSCSHFTCRVRPSITTTLACQPGFMDASRCRLVLVKALH